MPERSLRRAPAVERAARILDHLAQAGRPVGLSDLSRDLGVPKSSALGICETLVACGVLRPETEGYALSSHCLRWSAAYLSGTSLVSEFRRILLSDRGVSAYTVTLSTLDKDHVTYLDCRNSEQPLGFTFRAGLRLPAVYSATGKAMLAYISPEERRRLLSNPWPAPLTPNGSRDAQRFEDEMRLVRARGYAIDNGEIREGMICVGVPVMASSGQPSAGIAVSLTAAEATPERCDEIGARLSEVAASLALV
ncbi:IclR family transcriptional regulator [Alloyangia pacifica]|uniref:Transcriptional regulator, IclR family n=1 Tax=Alloyangia pacifica TaxID=311180 RepID=A0A1I6V001_9RHOB|nr:IclR family transcriptional regulator [Alloyangia pacifica]SDI32514.1 transcriptional regulator, IclR family [Alloyangia pacifica]SFT07009.1 transcriptional regulator, IclR family [Alloyangia pacifica]